MVACTASSLHQVSGVACRWGGDGVNGVQADRRREREWSYVKVPHSQPTLLERRLGDVASMVAQRPVQVRCEELSIGTREEPGGSLDRHPGGGWPD
jgi:hypothetical protein